MAQNMTWIDKHDPMQERAAMHWEQGLPLGNGRIGAMVWGGGAHRPLTVSLDQAEIWDMRTWLPAADKTWTEYKALLEQDRATRWRALPTGRRTSTPRAFPWAAWNC